MAGKPVAASLYVRARRFTVGGRATPTAGLLCVPVGGGPPARSPHASLTARSGRSRSPARPRHRPRAPQPGPAGRATAHGHRSPSSRELRGGLDGFRGREGGIRMGPALSGRPHLRRGIEPAGDVAVTCRPRPWRRRSCRPWRPGRRVRSRAPREDRRWCGRSRMRGQRAGSGRRRADRRASCRPS